MGDKSNDKKSTSRTNGKETKNGHRNESKDAKRTLCDCDCHGHREWEEYTRANAQELACMDKKWTRNEMGPRSDNESIQRENSYLKRENHELRQRMSVKN